MAAHPELPPGGWLGVSASRLVALVSMPEGIGVVTAPGTVETVVPFERVKRSGRRVRLDGRKVRLVGPGDFAKKHLGEDPSSGLFDGSAGGADPISAIIGVVEVVVAVVAAPFAIAGAIGRWSRGRREARRLAAALASAA